MLNWFPVHPVSLNNTNRLLSSDNKGFAQQWLEKRWAPHHRDTLEESFTAAFAQTNSKWAVWEFRGWGGGAICLHIAEGSASCSCGCYLSSVLVGGQRGQDLS
jgi:hypothetical protein